MSAHAESSAAWTQTPERSNLLLMRAMAWISLRLGRNLSRLLLHPIVIYFLLCSPTARRAATDYLRRALGGKARWRDLYRNFFAFATTIHDRVYLAHRRFDMFEFDISGQNELDQLLARGNGVFLIGAHLGSFDVIRAVGRKHSDLRVAMMMHEGNARKINAILAALNPQAVQEIIALGRVDSMLKVSERLAEGYAIGILADRSLANDSLQSVHILGAEAQLALGPFRMAALLRRPVIFMTGLYLGGNRYAVHFDPLADFSNVARGERDIAVRTAVTRYAALLDHYCRLAPYNWFNFFEFWPPGTAAASVR